MNRRYLSALVFLAGLVAVLLTATRFASRATQAAGSYKPFKATVLTRFYDHEGKLNGTKITLGAVRADGSIAELVETIDDRPSGVRHVSDLPRSLRVVVDTLTESRTTYHWGAREIRSERDPSGGCKFAPDAPTDTILGVEARRYEKHWTAGTRQIDEEGWVAPLLGCYALKRSYDVSESGQKIGSTASEVVSITFGDPPGELFDVPANYTERKPSELMALHAEKLGKRPPAYMQRTGPKVDEVYDSRHKP